MPVSAIQHCAALSSRILSDGSDRLDSGSLLPDVSSRSSLYWNRAAALQAGGANGGYRILHLPIRQYGSVLPFPGRACKTARPHARLDVYLDATPALAERPAYAL